MECTGHSRGRAVALPLACGNTVILKTSEVCPRTHHLIGEILRDAGLPNGVVNVITNAPEHAPEVVEALIGHPAGGWLEERLSKSTRS
jgi:vanillin dehydrogenase